MVFKGCINIMNSMNDEQSIKIYAKADFVGMRAAGRLAAEVLDMITAHIEIGITTEHLDRLCHDFIVAKGGFPASLGYRGFTKSTCISLNHVVCHGIPGARALVEGDILNIDLGVILDGWHGDSSRMYTVGKISVKSRLLIDITYKAMMRGISVVRPGATIGDIGHAVQSFVGANRFSVVEEFCGHGLGRGYHEAPTVPHCGRPGTGIILKPGMFFTVEPMVNTGGPGVKVLNDGWTAVTRDRSLSAQFEHSLGVTETGAEVFTLSPSGHTKPPYNMN